MPEQEDLTADDNLVEQIAKVFPADDDLPAPTQDRGFVPASVVDEHGDRP